MSLTQALSTALSGLNAAQTGLSLVAGNVANAQTPGYVRKSAVLVESGAGSAGASVRVAEIQRVLDQFVQGQLRTESAGAAYADVRASLYSQLQGLYGAPGSVTTLESALNTFTNALQALTTSPDDRSAQSAVINAAQGLTQQLNSTSAGIQSLRGGAELAISDDVNTANNAMQQIAALNQKITAIDQNDSSRAALEDERDSYVDQLAKLMDVRVIKSDNNQVSVFTNSGVQLVGVQAGVLSFDAQGTMTPQAKWSADPTQRTVGTITLTTPNGGKIDMIAANAIRSGEISGYVEMRDKVLTQAEDQLDQFAAAMASALSDTTTDGTPVSSGAQNGFDLDTAPLLAGNSISVAYTDIGTGTQRKLTFVRVDDPSALPLQNTATLDPNDTVVGIDFSGGTASVAAQINAALSGTGLAASNPSGSTVRLLDDGGVTATLDAASTTSTATSLTGGVQLPFFMDGLTPYSGAITATNPQSVGLAARIGLNPALIADPGKLVSYQAGTLAGDGTRPNFLYDRMVNAALSYGPSAGIGSTSLPFSGNLSTYLRQIVSLQGEAANNATQLKQGQDVVLTALQQRFSHGSSVNVDEEMSNLLTLQNAYAANARVMSTVKDMITQLLQMGG
jgi:flagellar hook-associated protein 1 FlgK